MRTIEIGRQFGILAVLALVAACAESPTAPDLRRQGEFLQTNQLTYVAEELGGSGTYTQYGFTVEAIFQNRTDATVYLDRCFPDSPKPMYGVELVYPNDDWGASYARAWGCVGHDEQFAIPPGGLRTDTLLIQGPNAWDGHTKEAFGVLEGTFRLVYGVRRCPGECSEVVAAEMRVSNNFQVSLAD